MLFQSANARVTGNETIDREVPPRISKIRSTHMGSYDVKMSKKKTRVGRVRLTQLHLPSQELAKLSSTERKHYVMITCIVRDLLLFQKFLLYSSKEETSTKAETSAYAANTLFLLTQLASKLHEAGNFLKKEKILENAPPEIAAELDKVTKFYADPDIDKVLRFIRNKFGFHYDTYPDLDPKIDSALQQLGELEMWLSEEDAGNEIFSSTNSIISEVLYTEAQKNGFAGDRTAFTEYLFDLVLKGCKVVSRFCRGYLALGFSVTWDEKETVDLDVPVGEDISLPNVIASGK